MRISRKYLIRGIILIVLIGMMFMPINVYTDTNLGYKVYDDDGDGIQGVVVVRRYKFDLYMIGCQSEEKVTDKNGNAHFWHIQPKVPLIWYVFWNVTYQLSETCPCCLADTFDYIKEETIPKKDGKYPVVQKYSILNTKYVMVRYFSTRDIPEVDITSIDNDKLMNEVGLVMRIGLSSLMDSNFPEQIAKFKPDYVTVHREGIFIKYSDGTGFSIRKKGMSAPDQYKTENPHITKILKD